MLYKDVFDHLEIHFHPDWLGVKCNRASSPAVREFLVGAHSLRAVDVHLTLGLVQGRHGEMGNRYVNHTYPLSCWNPVLDG